MKKTYMSPQCEEIKLNNRCTLLNGSSIKGLGDMADVGYGGVDDEGLDPESRKFDELDEDLDEEEDF